MTFRSFIRDGGVDKKGADVGPKFCVGLIVSTGEQGVRCAFEHRCNHTAGYVMSCCKQGIFLLAREKKLCEVIRISWVARNQQLVNSTCPHAWLLLLDLGHALSSHYAKHAYVHDSV